MLIAAHHGVSQRLNWAAISKRFAGVADEVITLAATPPFSDSFWILDHHGAAMRTRERADFQFRTFRHGHDIVVPI